MEAVSMQAKYAVGDVVWTPSSGPWTVAARYWRQEEGTVVYDLRFANGVVLPKWPEDRVFPTRQWWGYRAAS